MFANRHLFGFGETVGWVAVENHSQAGGFSITTSQGITIGGNSIDGLGATGLVADAANSAQSRSVTARRHPLRPPIRSPSAPARP